MTKLRNTFFIIAGILIGGGLLGWLGLQIQPKPFPAVGDNKMPLKTIPMPDGLPAPVEHFYETIYGQEIPVIETVIIQGRGVLKPYLNIPLPARFYFVHTAGKDYRHYFEATVFGIPLLKVNEGYLDGVSFFEVPMASVTDNTYANQAANLTLWAEAIWFPAIWLTDPRVHWESVDANSALLYVPFEEGEENFLVRFNIETGLIDTMETMRYRGTAEGQLKIPWILRNELKQPPSQSKVNSIWSAMWMDQGSPWAYFTVEELFVNTDGTDQAIQGSYGGGLVR